MEKILSVEDRIKRAEEIYYRKKGNFAEPYRSTTTVNYNEKKNYGLLKKIFVQIIICSLIYISYSLIQNNKLSFAEKVKEQIKNILEYDINFDKYYIFVNEKINNIFAKNVTPEQENLTEQNNVENTVEETLSATDENQKENNEENKEETSSISQMEEDANFVKANNNLVVPLKGVITSRFGPRNPTTETVPKYHTGIDIADNEGTVIIASMEGTVIQVSSQGDYRQPLKNRKR